MALSFYAQVVSRARVIHRVDVDVVSRITDLEDPDSAETDVDSATAKDEAQCLEAAVSDYSHDRPRALASQISATGENSYDLETLVPGWNDDTHQVLGIQYPLDDATQDTLMDDNDWRVRRNLASGLPELLFLGSAPDADFGLLWSEPHIVRPDSSTVPQRDKEMLAQRLAFHVLTSAASRASVFTEASPLSGDSVSYTSIADNFRKAAEACAAEYERLRKRNPAPLSPTFVDSDIEIGLFGSTAWPAWRR